MQKVLNYNIKDPIIYPSQNIDLTQPPSLINELNSASILSRGNSNRYVYRNFWVYDEFWKLHIFQLKLFLRNVDQIKRYFVFGILFRLRTPKKICVLIFQVLPNILNNMYLLGTIWCVLRVKMEALLKGLISKTPPPYRAYMGGGV